MELRALNDEGMREAAVILDQLRSDAISSVPPDFLTAAHLSSQVGGRVSRPKPGDIPSRWHLGIWLTRHLEGVVSDREIFAAAGMWTWLAFFLFDLICPVQDGRRHVADDAKYILVRGDYRKSYRHLVAGPYFLVRATMDSPSVMRPLLSNPLDRPGEIYEQLASRKQLVTSPGVLRVANRLYWDPRGEKVRRGAAGSGAGSVRRFANVLMQYDVTHDLYTIGEEKLLSLLPAEFDRFRRAW